MEKLVYKNMFVCVCVCVCVCKIDFCFHKLAVSLGGDSLSSPIPGSTHRVGVQADEVQPVSLDGQEFFTNSSKRQT